MLKSITKLVLASRFRQHDELDLNLGGVEIDENQIKSDFDVLDRYQSFSSEMLRLSLIGIGAYAFFLKEAPDIFRQLTEIPSCKILSMTGLACFALAVATTLVHRYYSSDAMAYHIRYLRLKVVLENPSKSPLNDHTEKIESASAVAQEEKSDRDAVFQLCEVMIAASAFFLGVGAISLAVSLLMLF